MSPYRIPYTSWQDNWKYELKELAYSFVSSKRVPKHNLVILCNPRSGSTWLFDALRSHPGVYLAEKAGFHNALQLLGARYPFDLARTAETSTIIEIRPGRSHRIPKLAIPKWTVHETLTTYALEKLHPEFYRFQTKDFLQKIKTLQAKGHIFKFIILLRHPISALKSFRSYQQRNPGWYAHLSPELLVDYTLETFRSLLLFFQNAGGLVLDYRENISQPEAVLTRTLQFLWPDTTYASGTVLQEDVQAALALTERKKRQGNTPFLGKKLGPIDVRPDELDFYEARFEPALAEAIALYQKLIAT